MDGIRHLARALEIAAARRGVPVVVNGVAAPGQIGVSLGLARDGRVTMLRQPAPGEGGRTTLNYPNDAMTAGLLNDRTLVWVDAWAMELTRIGRHADTLTRRGLTADDFLPEISVANEVAVRALSGLGHDLGRMLDAAEWRRSQHGYTARIEHSVFIEEAVFHRHLHQVLLENVSIDLGSGVLMVNDHASGATSQIEIHGGGEIPDTIVSGAIGRRIGEVAALPGGAGATTTIAEASLTADHALVLATDLSPATLA